MADATIERQRTLCIFKPTTLIRYVKPRKKVLNDKKMVRLS